MNNNKEKSAGFVSKLRKIETIAETLQSSKTLYSPKKQCRFVCKKSPLWKGRKTLFFAAKNSRKWRSCFRPRRAEKRMSRKGEKQVRQKGISRGIRVVLFAHEIVCDFRFAEASNSRPVVFSLSVLFAFSYVLVAYDNFSYRHCSFWPVNSIPTA